MARYQIRRTGHVLWVSADGITTLRDVQDYIQDFRATIGPVIHQPWACVLDLRHWQPSPAELFGLLRDNTRWSLEHNLQLAIVLMPENALLAWQYLQSTQVEKHAGFTSLKAQSDAEVLELLQQHGFVLQDS